MPLNYAPTTVVREEIAGTRSMTSTSRRPDITIDSLRQWLDACPTPFHVVDLAARTLTDANFLETTELGIELPTRGFIRRDGAIVAWRRATHNGAPFHVVGAHTDSPNLRVQPQPDLYQAGCSQLAVEIYGGVLLNSWLDRDLGIAGRIVTSDGEQHLFHVGESMARIPQLAIHLDREVNDKGLVLNKQTHMMPLWATGTNFSFVEWLSSHTGVATSAIAAFDAHLFDNTPAALLGHDQSFLASGRLDNQVSCWAAIHALVSVEPQSYISVVVLNDHEEVGSVSTTGADGPLLDHVLTSLSITDGSNISQHSDTLRASMALSVDNAHALHPNYQERHDPRHAPIVNQGIALKVNGNQRYASSATGVAYVKTLAAKHTINLQNFVTRNDIPCGSTIGPITAGRLGIDTVDIGVPQLSMHSAREMCGAKDPMTLLSLLAAFFSE
jgi:aspartyl aminopeptidase